MNEGPYFVMWRENFEDHHGWFTEKETHELIDRVQFLERNGDGEAEVYLVIEGEDVSRFWGLR